MEFVPEEIVREILLKLPTRDAARCSCVSKLWRGVVADRSFRSLHGAKACSHVISGGSGVAAAEALLVSHNLHTTTVFSVSSGKPMRRFADLDGGYRPTNACNGFICLAPDDSDAPVLVCNPVTGEMLRVPTPPPLEAELLSYQRMFAMGFCRSTRKYKVFRFSFEPETPRMLLKGNHLDAYTFGGGGGGGWRRHPRSFPHDGVRCGEGWSLPVLVDGKMYVWLTQRPRRDLQCPDRMLEVDMASEAHRTHRLPQYRFAYRTVADAFELHGRLCFDTYIIDSPTRELHLHLHLWTMSSPQACGMWEQHYSFLCPAITGLYDDHFSHCDGKLRANHGMLCYVVGYHVYKYNNNNNNNNNSEKHNKDVLLAWDHQHQLLSNGHHPRWNIYGGYHPSLLSPHDLAGASAPSSLPRLRHIQQHHDDNDEMFEYDILHALGFQKSSDVSGIL